MTMRLILSLLALAMLVLPVAAASPFAEAARRLDGLWTGDDSVLQVDSRRAQARMDPDRPFQWQRFAVREIRDGAILFAVGAELYEADLDGDTLTLTGTAFVGARLLHRQDADAAVRAPHLPAEFRRGDAADVPPL